MGFEVVIPSTGNISNLEGVMKCLNFQTLRPDKVNVLIDREVTKDDFDVLRYFLGKCVSEKFLGCIEFYSNVNSYIPVGSGVSNIRNFGAGIVKEKFVCFLDDDNIFEENFFEELVKNRIYIKEEQGRDLLLSPTIVYRKTGEVQSQGIKDFNYWLSKVVLKKINHAKRANVKMVGSNSIFGPVKLWREIGYDENFKFVYEDLDFSYRVYKAGYRVVVSGEVFINHMERKKTRLEKSFIGSPDNAYQKAKNRILFVRKNADFSDKMKFFLCGLWIQSFWFLFLTIFWTDDKISIAKAIFSGSWHGISQKIK